MAHRWYSIQTYAGSERSVKAAIENIIASVTNEVSIKYGKYFVILNTPALDKNINNPEDKKINQPKSIK